MVDRAFLDDDAQEKLDREAEIDRELRRTLDPYDQLPVPIQLRYTREEYRWLTEADKASLIQRECDPEF